MNVSRNQIANGVADYIKNEMAPNVTDPIFRTALKAFSNLVRMDPSVIDRLLLATPVAQIAIQANDDGTYKVDAPMNAIRETLRTEGPLTYTVHRKPLVASVDQDLTFGPADIDKLMSYMERQAQ